MVQTRMSKLLPAIFLRDAAVLREALLGDVERGLIFTRATMRAHERARRAARDVELAVDAVADDDLLLFRLDVDIARALLHRLGEERVDPADDRRLVVGVEDVDRPLRRRPVVGLELAAACFALVDAVDRVDDRVGRRYRQRDRLPESGADVVQRRRYRADRRTPRRRGPRAP